MELEMGFLVEKVKRNRCVLLGNEIDGTIGLGG